MNTKEDRRAVCDDIPHFYVRNSASAEFTEECAMREGWLAERCTGHSA